MDHKASSKSVVFIVLLILLSGEEHVMKGVEGRNINIPCNTVSDCTPVGQCECRMGLCFCHQKLGVDQILTRPDSVQRRIMGSNELMVF
ncbi:hypothetical protein LINPERHAP2_LOCUS18022 [Linum perenne]